MKPISRALLNLPDPSRRRFIKGLAVGGMLLALPSWVKTAQAKIATPAEVLVGTEFDLTIAETPVDFTGEPRVATTVNGSMPAPTLRWREGDTVTIRVTNRLAEETSIHWHGIILPYEMDGVPGISFKGIAPGETFTYRFKVQQSGTYWYHSHSGMQEQTGLYGAIIIDPVGADPIQADRDYVVLLSDWTDEDPMTVFGKLKKQSDYYNFNQPTALDFSQDMGHEGLGAAISKRHMWNMMRMNMTDLADISAFTYTYLMNGTTPAGNWTGIFRPGEQVRLRLINATAQNFFDLRIPGLKMQVVQADGQNIEPVTVDEIRLGAAETYDVLVTPSDEAYTLFAQTMDRSGYACGTLATRAGMKAALPSLDKPESLTMMDMMGNMGNDDMAEMHHEEGMDHHAHAMGHVTVRHASTEYGPSVDMRVDTPRTNLDDPGIGLRNNGRRVLTYADLHTLGGAPDPRKPDREIELHLTGNMERYSWSIDGLEFGKSTPVHFRYGERLRVIFVNDTMMAHPMHLHGLWSDLESPDGHFQVRKHTIIVQPAQRVTFQVTADALGRWAWHCHLFYHMHAGMMREVVVA
ncbi:copper resistance system multicopper oxidase [Methylobacter sp. BlB1]|jgi:CopA family copper-resistance protein|uniref:copper resistance system multicopper oxidase n=1 Tax=Methylobacter sp. BlB1 TaxID=2785914 RepID=UPI0018933D0A|nr:copper resistance system multicopper oxidase [Methylobacter sp. BlB1]MBF6649781.1 copper resistance system multicopper oxidase [Methylobacter sp. BlB1]